MLTIIRAGITTGGTNLPFIAQIPRWFPGDPRPQFWSPASASTDVSTVLSVHSMRNRLRPEPVFSATSEFARDSPLEEDGFELVWGFSCQVVVFGLLQFFVRSGKAVLRPVAYDQVRGARGRGQGTETLAKLSGLPLSGACVSQRLDA